MKICKYLMSQTNSLCCYGIILTLMLLGFGTAAAQQNIAQQAYAIFQQNCLNCHGPHGAFTEALVIESAAALIDTGTVVPRNPESSEFYKRLLDPDNSKRMPLGQPPLQPAAIETIRQWIAAGAPSWEVQHDINFITTDAMLTAIQTHLAKLPPFDREFARYFTLTHLYNAGESPEALKAYQLALSKLVNSLSWEIDIINPEPIGPAETIFFIDLRDYEWDIDDKWTQIEQVYPYRIEFDSATQAGLLEKLTYLRQEMSCDVPYVSVDWFLATASLPPLYHDILDLPETDRQLEQRLEVDVARNLQSAPGKRVWRAGFNDSGVSSHNRVVERHTSRYGAYWKSYDFAGSVGAQNIFTHPLSFRQDGGEIVFNLPNGLQAYYISDGLGNRIDVAPTDIVSNPAASDPAVHNGLSCIGCHTEGMKTFEDRVRSVIERTDNPAYDKAQALRLYVEQATMDELVQKDTARFREALEETGGVFGGIEPVHRFHEAFQGPLDAAHAAAAVGWETEAFLRQVSEKSSLQNLGLAGLLSGGNVKRDAWTSNFSDIVSALHSADEPTVIPPPVTETPRGTVYIRDENLRSAIASALGKAPDAAITEEDMARLTRLEADEAGIRDLTGLEAATSLERIELRHNAISDLSPLAGLTRLDNIKLRGNAITDVSPLARLINVDWLGLEENKITDLSPLKGLIKLNGIGISGNPISDVSPLASLISLEGIGAWRTAISDFSPLAKLPRLRWIEFSSDKSISELPSLKGLKALRRLKIVDINISDISGLAELTQLTSLEIHDTLISDVSPLAKLTGLTFLNLERNLISDISPLARLTRLEGLHLNDNAISDVSPLAGLSNLEILNLRGNEISDFSPLEGLPDKTFIMMAGNPGFPTGGPQITGPWLWVMVPGPPLDRDNTDLLAQASGGTVTELAVATNGATEGEFVGNSTWIAHKITAHGGNIEAMADVFGETGSVYGHVVYGAVTLDSPREQHTKMFAGSDMNHKVWLNGKLVDQKLNRIFAHDYQYFFPVTLKQGLNVLLVAVDNDDGHSSGHFGFAPEAEYTALSPGPRFTLSTETTQVEVGDTFTLHLSTADVTDVAGWQTDIVFDPAILEANSMSEGSFLKQGNGQTFFQKGTMNNEKGRITGLSSARTSEGGVSGEGTLLSVTFTAQTAGKTRLLLRNFQAGSSTGETIPATPPEIIIVVSGEAPAYPKWDVNADGQTDVKDLILVTAVLGQASPEDPRTDVNGDGVVDGKDVALVAEHLGEGAAPAAPSNVALPASLTPKMVEQALDILRAADDGSLTFRRGIANLKRLLAAFIPEKTALLHNYPNPFNPETWIPYHLAEPADVTLTIYAASGVRVRTLALGHQPAGRYQHRSRAAYWDGKNEVGEAVASGVYFYTLSAGDFTATGKMLIRK